MVTINNTSSTLGYNLSPILKQNLERIDKLNIKILIFPISRKSEIKLVWEATISRIYWSLALDNKPLTKSEIVNILLKPPIKPSAEQAQALAYKKSLDLILQNWFVTNNFVSPRTVEDLSKVLSPYNRLQVTTNGREIMSHIFNYLQNGSENPIIQAGIVQLQLKFLLSSTSFKDSLPRFMGSLMLYRYGKSFRNLLVLEEYFKKDFANFEQVLQGAIEKQNMTLWLEYYTNALIVQLEKCFTNISNNQIPPKYTKTAELTDRQKAILSLLEYPDQTITNRKVQKHFKVSQITSSRELKRLVVLNLIFPYGKGRSTYYTKT